MALPSLLVTCTASRRAAVMVVAVLVLLLLPLHMAHPSRHLQ
jgi:hypothetical protein